MSALLPAGFGIDLDPATRRRGSWLIGGTPTRMLRLSPTGEAAFEELQAGPAASRTARLLGRRLTDAGLAHPRPIRSVRGEVTVVIPVFDRADHLDRCLAALGGEHRVIVVDDGSAEPYVVAGVADAHGAQLIRLPHNRGPAAARNAGLSAAGSEFVAFLDSDCLPTSTWIEELLPHLADETVAVVAPRVVARAGSGWLGDYNRAACSLDLGAAPALVRPGGRVGYVPTAAWLARRSVLVAHRFDESMRVGEDVDLIWRVVRDGWRVRYEPRTVVEHSEPSTWRGMLGRRARYGTSVAPLSERHPGALAHLRTSPGHALSIGALLMGRPRLGAATAVATAGATMWRAKQSARQSPVQSPAPVSGSLVARGMLAAFVGAGRYVVQLAAPAAALTALVPGRGAATRRLTVAALIAAPPLTAWLADRPSMDPVRYALSCIADDVSYGSGVWRGCLRHRTLDPLRPNFRTPRAC